MAVTIRDISDQGRKAHKRLTYEVGVLHTNREDEPLDLAAKFRCHGDARRFAEHIANGNVYFAEVVIR